MNIENKAYLAVDTAYQTGVVTLFMNNEVIFSKILTEKMAHGKEICQAINDAMKFCETEGLLCAGVFTGLGPGSFVGVRIAVATVLGFTLARSLPLMGFCSHSALGFSTKKTADDFYVFMKASGDLGYATHYGFLHSLLGEKGATKVISVHDFLAEVPDCSIVYSDMEEKLVNKNVQVERLCGPSAEGVMHAALNRMALSMVDESDTIKPNYIKPPNVSLPKKSLIFHLQAN